MADADDIVALRTEVQLLGWSETSTRGRTVTFQLPADEDTHPMRDYAFKSGKQAGHRFYMVLVELNDQEQPVKQEVRLSQRAAALCKSEQFWSWAGERSICDIRSEDDARSWMLNGAGIKSRKEFDTNRSAADWFTYHCLIPFHQYMDTINNNSIGGK